jgi:predicted small lipoprotein YifL
MRFLSLLLIVLVASLAGCAKGPVKADPAVVAELRAKLLLAEEPADAQTLLDWREGEQEGETITLVGQIGGMPNPWGDTPPDFPWRAGEATFFVVDPATVAEFADHAAEDADAHAADCPFCARKAASKSGSVAAVSFLASDGQAISIDARELLGVKTGDVVVVHGRPKPMGEDLLVIEAEGLFIRQ